MSSTTPPPNFGLFTSLRYDAQLLASEENTKLSGNGQTSPLYNLVFHYERLVNALDHFGWSIKISSNNGGNIHSVITPTIAPTTNGSYPETAKSVSNIEQFREICNAAVDRYFTGNVTADRNAQALKLRPVISRDGVLDIDVTATPPIALENLFPPNPLPTPSQLNEIKSAQFSGFSDSKPPGSSLLKDYTVLIDTISMIPSSYTEYKTTPRPHYDAARLRVGLQDDSEPKEVLIWNPEGNVMEGSRTNIYFYRVGDGQGGWVTPTDSSGCLRGTERRWLLERGMVKLQDIKKDDVQDQEFVLLSNGLRGIWAATISK